MAGAARIRLRVHLTALDDDHTVVSVRRAPLGRAPLATMVIQIAGTPAASLHNTREAHDLVSTPNNHARHGRPTFIRSAAVSLLAEDSSSSGLGGPPSGMGRRACGFSAGIGVLRSWFCDAAGATGVADLIRLIFPAPPRPPAR